MFVLALPLQTGSNILTIAAFVGGLSAATAMVIVELVALSIMVSNDIVMPLVLQRREALISGREDVGSLLLTVRRLAIFAILLLAYMYYRTAGDAQLFAIGMLAFAAIAQLAPAFFGGLFWRRATAGGAIAGMTAGILVWAYTLLLPTFADIGVVGQHILTDGPWGLAMLRPQTSVRARAVAAGAWRGLEPGDQSRVLCRLLLAPTRPRRSNGCRPTSSCRRIWRRSRRASGSGAPR